MEGAADAPGRKDALRPVVGRSIMILAHQKGGRRAVILAEERDMGKLLGEAPPGKRCLRAGWSAH